MCRVGKTFPRTGAAHAFGVLNPKNRAERAAFARKIKGYRSWIDLRLGSTVGDEDKAELLREALSDVIAGKTSVSSTVYKCQDDFDTSVRHLLNKRIEDYLG